MARYYLSDKDRRGLKKLIKDVGAGKGVPSRRPVPTRRRPTGSSGITDHYQIIRGTCVAAVLDTDQAFQLENLVALEQYSTLPDSPVWVANIPAVAHSEGDTVYALWREGIAVTHTGAPATVDWEALGGSTSSVPPLKYFELTATKLFGAAYTSATAKFVQFDGGLDATEQTLTDPDGRFAGRAALYLPGERGFRGYALQRSDPEEIGTPRYEIVAMESFAGWAIVEYYGVGIWLLSATGGYGGVQWDIRKPTLLGTAIGVIDPAGLVPSAPATGTKYIANLADPNTTPPTYAIVGARGGGTGGGGLMTVYIDHTIPAATASGLTGFTPGESTVSKYEYNDDTGVYSIGDSLDIENHDTEALEVASEKKYRGLCALNEYGKWVLQLVYCRPLN